MAEARRLASYPRSRLVDRPALRGVASELDLLTRLGEPTSQTPASDDEPIFFWDLAWPCGLLTSVEFHQLSQRILVRLDEIEVEHALRHLGLRLEQLERTTMPGPPTDAELWRTDADGVQARVARNLTVRDARCRLDDLATADPQASFAVIGP